MAVGCSLTFAPEAQGILYSQFSTGAPEGGALAFFEARKAVPAFKLKGRTEIIREMSGGTGDRRKKYFSGWCSFVKQAKAFYGLLTIFGGHDLPKVDVYVLTTGSAVTHVKPDEPFDLKDAAIVAVVPSPSSCFAPTMSPIYFTEVANRGGVALTLSSM